MSCFHCWHSDIFQRRRTFLRHDFAAPSIPPLQKPGGFFPLPDALAFVPLLSSFFLGAGFGRPDRRTIAAIACLQLLRRPGAGAALLLLVVVAVVVGVC